MFDGSSTSTELDCCAIKFRSRFIGAVKLAVAVIYEPQVDKPMYLFLFCMIVLTYDPIDIGLYRSSKSNHESDFIFYKTEELYTAICLLTVK
jgi:hypothetical protein